MTVFTILTIKGTCVDQESWCSFADPDCNKDRVRAICPKSCNICIGKLDTEI